MIDRKLLRKYIEKETVSLGMEITKTHIDDVEAKMLKAMQDETIHIFNRLSSVKHFNKLKEELK